MIEEEVVTAIAEFKRLAADDLELQKLSAFYEEMKKAGVAQNQRFSLPPVDTIGSPALRQRSPRDR